METDWEAGLVEGIDADQQRAIDVVYDLLVDRGSWPTFAVVDRRLDHLGLDAEEILGRLPAGLIRGDPRAQRWYRPDQEVSLSLTGVAASTRSGADIDLLVAFVQWLADQERGHDPDAEGAPLTIDAQEALTAVGVSTNDASAESIARRLFALIDLLPGLWSAKSAREDPPWWSVTVARGIRRLRGVTGPEDLVARTAAAWLPAEAPLGSPVTTAAPDQPGTPDDGGYDVALSFAGEERGYVERVATRLKALGVVVFYDRFEAVELWGGNLIDRFADVYGRRAKFVVMFVSAAYAEKAWTNEERRQAQARALETRLDSVLPVRFDDTDVPGLAATVHYVSASDYSPEDLADLIFRKLGAPKPATRDARSVWPPVPSRLPSEVASEDPSSATPLSVAVGASAPSTLEQWAARHRESALVGLAQLGKADFFEVTAAVNPQLPMPSQRRLSDAVASKNIDTFGWPIGVYIPSQPPHPVVEGIITEIQWAERSTYDYWALSRTGLFYLLKTLSEDALDAPDKLYFNTRIVRVAETAMFLAALYAELGANEDAEITLNIVHTGMVHRTLTAVGSRRMSFTDRRTTENQVLTSATFRISDANSRLIDIVKELLDPLFMVYEYLEITDPVYTDIVEKFRVGEVT